MNSSCLAPFTPFSRVAQCWEVRIHLEITSGEHPLPIKKRISLKVSLSPVGFFQNSCCMLMGQVRIG